MFKRTLPHVEHVPFWRPRETTWTIFAFPFCSFGRVHCCCSASCALFLRDQHVLLLLLEDVIRHSPSSLVASWLPFYRTMSCWCNVKAFFVSVDFLTCFSCKFSITCWSKPDKNSDLLSTMARQCTLYIHTQLLSVPQSWSSVVSILVIRHWRTPWLAPENDSRQNVTHSHIISSWQRNVGWRDWLRPGSAKWWLLDSSFVWWKGGRWALNVKTLCGPCLVDRCCLLCRDAQEEHLWNLILGRSDVDDDGASCDSTSTITFFTPSSSGSRIRSWWCIVSNQQSREPKFGKILRVSSMWKVLDVRGNSLDVRRISNSGRRRRSYSSLVWSRSLRWCWSRPLSSRRKSRRQRLTSSSCRRMRTRTEEYKKPGARAAADAHSNHDSHELWSEWQCRIRWRHGGDCRSDMTRRQEEENGTFCARSFVLDGALFWNSKRWSDAGSPTCLATRRRWRTSWMMGSNWLVLSHWCQRNLKNIWSPTRIACEHSRMRAWKSWRTWRRSSVWEFVVPSRVTLRSHGCWCNQLSLLPKEKDHRVRAMGVLSAVEQSYGKGTRSKSWSKSEPSFSSKGKSKENKGKSIGTKNANQGAKGSHKGKTSKTGLSGLENSKSEASSDTQESGHAFTTDTSWDDGWNGDERNDGWCFDEWNDDWSSVGSWRFGCHCHQ